MRHPNFGISPFICRFFPSGASRSRLPPSSTLLPGDSFHKFLQNLINLNLAPFLAFRPMHLPAQSGPNGSAPTVRAGKSAQAPPASSRSGRSGSSLCSSSSGSTASSLSASSQMDQAKKTELNLCTAQPQVRGTLGGGGADRDQKSGTGVENREIRVEIKGGLGSRTRLSTTGSLT